MIFHGFIHSDADAVEARPGVFRSNVLQFINDTETHPIVKYKAFIVAGLLVVSGLLILLLFNGERIFAHSFWKHLFAPLSDNNTIQMSDAAIFREAVEGMTTTTTTTTTTKDGKRPRKTESSSAQTQKPQKRKRRHHARPTVVSILN